MSKLIIREQFATVPNELLSDNRISLKAKGLFGFLQGKPNEWKFGTEKIASQLLESEKVIRKTLQELERFGILERILKQKDNKGKWTGYDYILYSKVDKLLPNPSFPKATGRFSDRMDNGEDISKIDNSKIDIVKDKSIVEASSTIEVEVISNLVEDKNKYIQIIGLYAISKGVDFASRKQQQDFIKRNIRPARLIDSYDLDRIKDVMRYLINNADFKWTLESVSKYIDEDLNKLKSNNRIVIIQ